MNSYPKEYEYLCLTEKPEGYFLDSTIYRKCFDRCKNCLGFGNEQYNNCIECKSNYKNSNGITYPFLYELDIYGFKNCYIQCPYYFYYNSSSNIYYCTEKAICPQSHSKLILERNECVNKCEEDNIYKYEFRKRCYEQCPENSTEVEDNTVNNKYFCKPLCPEETPFEHILTQECVKNCPIKDLKLKKYRLNIPVNIKDDKAKIIDILLQNFKIGIISPEYNISLIEKGEDDVYEEEKMRVIITTTKNLKKKKNKNMTTIDLTQCENLLKKKNMLTEKEALYIMMFDILEEGIEIPKMEFDVYIKSSSRNYLKKLNLSSCDNTKLYYYINFNLTGNIDIFNSSSGYYNDICYKALSDTGTDIILNLCPGDCFFSEYDKVNKKAKCTCDVKQSVLSFREEINKTQLNNYFIDIKNIANIKLMKCYKELFNKDGIIINIAIFIIIPIQIFHIIAIIMFFIKEKKKIFVNIKDIEFAIKNWDLVKEEEMKGNTKLLNRRKKKNIFNMKNKGNNINKDKIIKNTIINTDDEDKNIIKEIILNKPNPMKKNNKIMKKNIIKTEIKKTSNLSFLNNKNRNNKQNIMKRTKLIMEYNDTEKNNLSYNLAIKHDKRTFCQYYISLIKTKHLLFFSFCNSNNKNYNSRIVKIDLFFISFTLYFAINALFFNDNTIHKIYEDKGSFNFIYQLPKIIYSSLISIVLIFILKSIALSERRILDYKKDKNIKDLNNRTKDLENILMCKFIFYFFISFIILLSFWYYLSMFCAIYKKSQYHSIINTLISFGISLIYSLVIYLLPGLFRIPALSGSKNNKVYLYNFSQFLQKLYSIH